jgi:hypothetical protein
MEFVTHFCRTCGGVTHPATGCVYSENYIVCRNCTVEAWAWIRQHMSSKGRRNGGPNFYNHVNTVTPGVMIVEPGEE